MKEPTPTTASKDYCYGERASKRAKQMKVLGQAINTDQIAAEARFDIASIVSTIARPQIDERVTSIIQSAIEKAREPLLDCISDARVIIERTISVMTEEQAGQVAGIRSWLEQAPYG